MTLYTPGQVAAALVPLHPHQRVHAGVGEQRGAGLLHRPPLHHVAPRLRLHPRLRLEDVEAAGDVDVRALLYVCGHLPLLRVQSYHLSALIQKFIQKPQPTPWQVGGIRIFIELSCRDRIVRFDS